MTDPPKADNRSIPSSVKKTHYEAEKAEKEAGEYVPIEALEELLEEWQDASQKATTAEQHGRNQMLGKCGRELEEVIENHD